MKAKVTTNGKEIAGYFWDQKTLKRKPYYFVQHWQLYINGTFITDSSVPSDAKLYKEIAKHLNKRR